MKQDTLLHAAKEAKKSHARDKTVGLLQPAFFHPQSRCFSNSRSNKPTIFKACK